MSSGLPAAGARDPQLLLSQPVVFNGQHSVTQDGSGTHAG
jgi:hypothetical protein